MNLQEKLRGLIQRCHYDPDYTDFILSFTRLPPLENGDEDDGKAERDHEEAAVS